MVMTKWEQLQQNLFALISTGPQLDDHPSIDNKKPNKSFSGTPFNRFCWPSSSHHQLSSTLSTHPHQSIHIRYRSTYFLPTYPASSCLAICFLIQHLQHAWNSSSFLPRLANLLSTGVCLTLLPVLWFIISILICFNLIIFTTSFLIRSPPTRASRCDPSTRT